MRPKWLVWTLLVLNCFLLGGVLAVNIRSYLNMVRVEREQRDWQAFQDRLHKTRPPAPPICDPGRANANCSWCHF